jgi:hypothetical protein
MEAFELSPTVIKAVGIGRIGGIGARILSELGSNGQDCTWFDAGGGDFNHSEFDVRSSLSGAHWLLVEASSFGGAQSLSSAAGAAMVFAELEGAKTVVIVDDWVEMEPERAWGAIVERIRQVGVICMTSEGRAWIAGLEGVAKRDVGGLLRSRGLVSVVAILDVEAGRAEVHHSLGVENGYCDCGSVQSLVERMLLGLPSSSYSREGIRKSAGI